MGTKIMGKKLIAQQAAVLPFVSPMVERENAIIAEALAILKTRVYRETKFDSPGAAKKYLTVLLSESVREEFIVLYLDVQHGLIAVETASTGTLTQTSVYPREIVRAAIKHNAGAVMLCHNHPSGRPEPSRADEMLTANLKRTLAGIDVTVLDHFIVAGGECMSFAESGLL